MGYYHEIGIHVPQSISEARKWYQLAADHGNKDAIGRLESLSQDQSLSKQDHETTTLTRIKSQHGSQRGKRPDRFKQPQQMPTLSETAPITPTENNKAAFPQPVYPKSSSAGVSPRVSPQPSPGIKPTIVSEHPNFPDPSRASVVGTDRPPAFSIRLDTNTQQPARPRSAAPYPDDDRPAPLNVSRPHSTAPYPDDDVRAPADQRYGSGRHPAQGPQADRPMSAFGIKSQSGGQRPMPMSQTTGSLLPQVQAGPPRGRVASAGWESQNAAGSYRQPSPGPNLNAHRPHPVDDMHGRLNVAQQAQPVPGDNMMGNRLQKQPPRQPYSSEPPAGSNSGREYGPRTSSRPVSDMPPQHDLRNGPQGHERFSRVPGATGRPERLSSLPSQDGHPPRVSSAFAPTPNQPRPGPIAGRTASLPPNTTGQRPPEPNLPAGLGLQSAATAPAKPAKGPATFEDMGIPQGKQEGDCVSHDGPFYNLRPGSNKTLQVVM
jgi:hypothetical protein